MSTNDSPIEHTPIYHRKGLIGYHFPGEGAPLFCLHGFGGSGLDFEALAAMLGGRVPMIALNLPGHGGRDVDVDGLQKIADDIRSVTTDPIRLLGYSMCGRFALRLAVEARVPIDSLYLIGTTPGLGSADEQATRAEFESNLIRRLHDMSPKGFQDWWSTLPIISSQSRMPSPYKERMHSRRTRNDPSLLIDAVTHYGTGNTPPMWRALNNLNVPTHLFVGETDHKYLRIAQDMENRMPNALLESIPNAGHAPHLETPQIMAERLLARLDNRHT
jgi:2-succinyl-6-hydroxy-2,4-cyclohexadiene-1-carboxylate synthase